MDRVININKYKECSDREETKKALLQKGAEIEKIGRNIGINLHKFRERMTFIGLIKTLDTISQMCDLVALSEVKEDIVNDEMITGEFEENLIKMVDLNIEITELMILNFKNVKQK